MRYPVKVQRPQCTCGRKGSDTCGCLGRLLAASGYAVLASEPQRQCVTRATTIVGRYSPWRLT